MSDETDDLRKLVAEVAAAYFANSHVGVTEISRVIGEITASLRAIGSVSATPEEPVEEPVRPKLTAAQVRKSITPEALISFEDGRPYKTLKRHLAVKGLSPQQYREKWNLPRDYPLVAANYSEARSKMARQIGLGGGRGSAPALAPESAPGEPTQAAPRRRRSTKKADA